MRFMTGEPREPRQRRRDPGSRFEGEREARSVATRLGGDLRKGRVRKRLTQEQVGQRIGIDQSRVCQLELGRGAGAPLGVWIAFGIAVGRPLAVAATRSLESEPRDAGHLAGQELVMRLAQANGVHATFELPTRPQNPALMVDVGLRDDRHRVLDITEIWNRLDDLGGARRTFKRKLAEAEALAVAVGGDRGPYRVTGCWVLRATAANRALLARYPTIFASEFPGSSRQWVWALTAGAPPPSEPGLVWIDVAGTRIYEARATAGSARNSAGTPARSTTR